MPVNMCNFVGIVFVINQSANSITLEQHRMWKDKFYVPVAPSLDLDLSDGIFNRF